MSPKVNTEDLVDSQEVAEILGLSHKNSVSTYVQRYNDFPRPLIERSGGHTRLWLRGDIVAWARARKGSQS